MNIVYIDKNGERLAVRGKVGDNVMYLAHRYGIELEGMDFKSNQIFIWSKNPYKCWIVTKT